MAIPEGSQTDSNTWDVFIAEVEQELQKTDQELKELMILLDQSENQIEKLAEKNATINMHLQKVINQMHELPGVEIQRAYSAAMDSQQRLILSRSQNEKLKNDRIQLNRYVGLLHKIKAMRENDLLGGVSPGSKRNAGVSTVEMMVEAQETERQKLSRRIHDGPAQTLSNFILQTEIALRLFDIDQEKAKAELNDLKQSANVTFQQVRDFIFELRPMMLDDLGLAPTIKKYLETLKEKTSVEINLSVTGQDRRLESYIEVLVFRAMQEILNYAIEEQHASQINIDLDMGSSAVRLELEENGKASQADEKAPYSLALDMIKERAEMMSGQFEIDGVGEDSHLFQLIIPI